MNKNSGEQEKIHYSCEGPSLGNHRLSSLGKPRDVKRRSLGLIFLEGTCRIEGLIFLEGRIEKSVSRESSLGKPRDAKRRSLGLIFLSFLHTHDLVCFI